MQNMSDRVDDWIKIAHPLKEISDHEFLIDFCNVYEDAQDHVKQYLNGSAIDFDVFHIPIKDKSRLIPCETFDEEPKYTSIITQFDLYCSRDILVAVTQFFHLFGVLCGGIVTTNMMKFIEPRQCMLIGMFTVSGAISSFDSTLNGRNFYSKSFVETSPVGWIFLSSTCFSDVCRQLAVAWCTLLVV